MSLYPLKFKPRFVEKIWGGRKLETVLGKRLPEGVQIGESWELYDFPPGVVDGSKDWISSEIANGPLAGRSLHWAVGEFGEALMGGVQTIAGQFPILIKFLDAREDLSVQVHPDEDYCSSNPGAHLKSEAWYVMQSEPGSRIYKGIRPGTTRAAFEDAVVRGTVEELLIPVPTKAGQSYYLPSGTVHALGAGILVAEVQTPSDTTFRLYDFNRTDEKTGKPRALHVKEALQCIPFPAVESKVPPRSHVAGLWTTVSRLVTSPFFKLEKVRFVEGVEEPVPYDQPVVWMVLEGEAQVKVDDVKDPVRFTRGDVVLLPAEMKNPIIKTLSSCSWLEVTFPTGADVE